MEMKAITEKAQRNLEALKANSYPGRGIVVGMDEAQLNLLQVYWLMGRGRGSRNRKFVDDGNGRLRTDLANPEEKPEDTSLIIYCAMAEGKHNYVVSNGHQTEGVLDALSDGESHYEAVENWDYEPDAPNFTPRITSTFEWSFGQFDISIIKKSTLGLNRNLQVFRYNDFYGGLGYCVTTYDGDGNPLPSFTGEPYLLPLPGENAKGVANIIWDHLNTENRVALAVKAINIEKGESTINIINRY